MNLIKTMMERNNQSKAISQLLTLGLHSLILFTLLFISTANAFYIGAIPNTDFKTGRVLARSIVLNPETGLPILVEFDEQGNEVNEVSLGNTSVSDVSVIPAADYRFFRNQLDEFRTQNAQTSVIGAELLSRNEFEQAQFLLADNQTVVQQADLNEGINSVFVRGQGTRILLNQNSPRAVNDQLILLNFTFDFTQSITVSDTARSLVVNREGLIVAQSDNTIGFRVGFFGDPNEPQNELGFRIDQDDTVFGPIQGVKVNVNQDVYHGGIDVTDEEGKYSFRFIMPLCPPGGFTFTTDVWAELRYRNFLPTGSPSISYYLRSPGYSSCFAAIANPTSLAGISAGLNAAGTLATLSTFAGQSNLFADVMFVNGLVTMANVDGSIVPVGETTYTSFGESAEQTTQRFYDFNGDGESDTVAQGRVLDCIATESDADPLEQKIFLADSTNSEPLTGSPDEVIAGYSCADPSADVAQSNPSDKGTWQGVFFDGVQDAQDDFPDLVRVIDRELRNEPIGVLESISAEDMRNTDVLFFREATGQLILERRGLKQSEASYRRAVEYDDENNEVAYRIMLRGTNDSAANIGGGINRRQSFEDWATEYQLTAPFTSRQSDQPRPGEFIKVVAINRATGYIGTARVQLQSAGDSPTSTLDVVAPAITLRPPNLKVWAERNYEVSQGLTSGEERTFTIGAEGAALTSDTTVTIFTEWLDENGHPLPDELGLDNGEQYGLTGRLSKVVAASTLQGEGAGSDLSEFPIAPGRQTQVIRVADNLSTAENFYIHVIGKARDQECAGDGSCPSFDVTSTDANFQGRPSLITPFLVPLADEDATWQQLNEFRRIESESEEELDIIEPLPAYAWQYRPEYQFSQFSLEVDEINRTSTNEDGTQETFNILNSLTPSISPGDDLISIFHSIISSAFDTLSPFDGPQELVLALGGNEVRVNVGENQLVTFDDLENLAILGVEDFLSIRLYLNNDASNVLWEWAFTTLDVDLDTDNNNGFDLPDRDAREEKLETQIGAPGKYIETNNSDVNNNFVVDYAEFYYETGEKQFFPLVIDFPSERRVSESIITFSYASSDPNKLETVIHPGSGTNVFLPAPGHMRIWMIDADQRRDSLPLSEGGHYVESGVDYLPQQLGFNETLSGRTIVLYVEGVRPSSIGDSFITVQVDDR